MNKPTRAHLAGLELAKNRLSQVNAEILDDLIAQASAAPEQEAEYWVLFDAKAEQRYIKKCIEDGTLAFFDNESDAKRAKLRNPGTDYKRVAYYTHADDGELEQLRAELNKAQDALRRIAKNYRVHQIHSIANWALLSATDQPTTEVKTNE